MFICKWLPGTLSGHPLESKHKINFGQMCQARLIIFLNIFMKCWKGFSVLIIFVSNFAHVINLLSKFFIDKLSCNLSQHNSYESESESCSGMSNSLQLHGLYSPWNTPGQNTGVGSLSLLQGIFPTQGSNPGLPHCRRILYQLNHKGSTTWLLYVWLNTLNHWTN